MTRDELRFIGVGLLIAAVPWVLSAVFCHFVLGYPVVWP